MSRTLTSLTWTWRCRTTPPVSARTRMTSPRRHGPHGKRLCAGTPAGPTRSQPAGSPRSGRSEQDQESASGGIGAANSSWLLSGSLLAGGHGAGSLDDEGRALAAGQGTQASAQQTALQNQLLSNGVQPRDVRYGSAADENPTAADGPEAALVPDDLLDLHRDVPEHRVKVERLAEPRQD